MGTETLNKNFKAITDVGSGAKHTQYKKNIQNLEFFNFLIFFFYYYIKQDLVDLSEFVVTRVHCTKYFFPRYFFSHLYGFAMTEL